MDKRALKALLADRRAKMDPLKYKVPVPTGRGRRAAGLRQSDIDRILNRSIGTYQRLESGAQHNPPVDYLAEIARLFDLTEEEWTSLNRYARGAEPPHSIDGRSSLEVPAVWEDAVHGINHMAYVTNHRWDVLAYNPPFAAMFPRGQVPDNVMRWMLTDPEARTVLTDWHTQWAPRVAPQLRATRAALPFDDELAELEQDVRNDPDAGPVYEAVGDTSIHPDGSERPLNHAEHGHGWVTLCASTLMSAPHARLMIMLFHTHPTPHTDKRPPLRAPDPDPRPSLAHIPGFPIAPAPHPGGPT